VETRHGSRRPAAPSGVEKSRSSHPRSILLRGASRHAWKAVAGCLASTLSSNAVLGATKSVQSCSVWLPTN
jgi:hypothetical protein